MFKIKCIVSIIFDIFYLNDLSLFLLNKKYRGNYIRVVNYHHTFKKDMPQFIKQLKWYKKNFSSVSITTLEKFLDGKIRLDKPGIIFTFDDGYEDNYLIAKEILNSFGFVGIFMVSADLIGADGYMSEEQLKDLIKNGHTIGDHTSTHYRIQKNAVREKLIYEISESKHKMEAIFKIPIDIFCWCGGEEEHYTKEAAKIIKESGYKYSFMTNSFPVLPGSNPFQIQRTNCESGWPISLIKFQLTSFMDGKFKYKRKRVNELTKI